MVGFTTKGTQNDQFAFVILRNVNAGTTVDLSDMNWTGTAFYDGTDADGGVIFWLADKAYPAGTLVQTLPTANGDSSSTHAYAVSIYSGSNTYTNVDGGDASDGYSVDSTSPIAVTTVANTGNGLTGLSSKGDQLFSYQGSQALGAPASSVTFISGFTYGAAWWTATPTPTGGYLDADTDLPPGLTDGVNAMAITLTYGLGGYYNVANGTTGTETQLDALLNDQNNWTLDMPVSNLPAPALSTQLTVQ